MVTVNQHQEQKICSRQHSTCNQQQSNTLSLSKDDDDTYHTIKYIYVYLKMTASQLNLSHVQSVFEFYLHLCICCILIYDFYKSANCHDNVKRF